LNRPLRIALVGNPNCGKTSLFNALTGLRQKVGNYPGITVDKKIGYAHFSKDVRAEMIDLPGTYSLYPKRIDEFITFDVLLNKENESYPDVILIVADASNLKRNLLFCSQIIDLGIPVVIALNMLDVARKNHISIDIGSLSAQLAVPIVPINAREGKGLPELRKVLSSPDLKPGKELIDVYSLAPSLIDSVKDATQTKSNYAAVQVAHHYMNIFCLDVTQKAKVKALREEHNFNSAKTQSAEIMQRYARINEIMQVSYVQEGDESRNIKTTSRIDHYLTHPIWGYLIFLLIFFLIFQAIFSWAQYPMNAIDFAFSWSKNQLHQHLPSGVLTDLFVEGILSGIGGVVVFIPQIMILFGFISLLEDTGYMSRVSFLMDKLMRKVGLSGKSTVPLISGLACAIPAIMSTRSIENSKDRLITIMVTPLMSCSARLPVYTLLVGFAVPHKLILGIFNLQGFVMLGLYLLGFFMAMIVAVVLRFIIRSKEAGIFMMELPIYRWPRWSNVGVTMVEKAKVFVTDAGKVIVVISVILWFLAAFGPGKEMQTVDAKYNTSQMQTAYTPAQVDIMKQSEKLQHSYAGHMGRFIEPVISPLGFDWKIGISIITAFAAREVFVGTMATIYSVGSSNESAYSSIRDKMKEDINPRTGLHVFTAASAFSLIIFFVLAMQCMSTLAVVKRETKSWKWPIIQLVYMTGLAWVFSFITYQLLK
jgi:ferrous iron transport protein B